MLNLKPKTVDAALGKWPGILMALGVDESFLSKKHGKCPFCGGTDRYRFDDKNGTGSFFCSQCGAGTGVDFLMRMYGWSFKEAASSVDRVVGVVQESARITERSEADKVAAIKKTLRECRRVENGDPVWLYLNRRTGLEIVPSDIWYHPGLWHRDGGNHPAMVSVLRGADGNGVTLHRTYLTASGEKANVSPVKMMMPGKRLNGAAVRLSRIETTIGISEGIETALSASVRFQTPVWAATNAALLEMWLPPAGIEHVIVFADNDASWTGHAAAFNLAKRLTRDGLKVDVLMPPNVGEDWCDAGKSEIPS